MASVIFTVESSELELGFLPSFELSDDDLPKDLTTGSKLRKTITRYAGTYTSVQVHGIELKPFDLEGVFEDSWSGNAGHAREMKNQIEAIAALGEIVRFEFDTYQLWGTLDAEFTESDPARIEYKLTFEPYWREDPKAQIYIAFAEPPNDIAEALLVRFSDAEDFVRAAPPGVLDSFVQDLIIGLASARSSVSDILGYITGVADYADLTAQQIGLVTRSAFAGVRTMESTIDRLKNAGDNVLDGTASGQLRGGDYIYEGTRQTQRATEGLVAMLRRFLETSRPKRQRTHIVREGDTLQRLAKIYLGDYTRWTEIADANDLVSSELVVGFSLLIPRR